MAKQPSQGRVRRRERDAQVADFHDRVDAAELFAERALGFGDVSGVPLHESDLKRGEQRRGGGGMAGDDAS